MRFLLLPLVRGATDAQLERRFGSRPVQRALRFGIARAFDPQQAFNGTLVYELTRPATHDPPLVWTLEIAGTRATARPGATDRQRAALTLRLPLADFMRMIAGTIDPAQPILQDRANIEGDLALAARLPEMFGIRPGAG